MLWPILHYRVDLAEFSRRDLSGYLRVNDHFARELHKVLGPDDTDRRVPGRIETAAFAQLAPHRRRLIFGIDFLIRQILLVPESIENTAAAGKTNAEDPGEVPHSAF